MTNKKIFDELDKFIDLIDDMSDEELWEKFDSAQQPINNQKGETMAKFDDKLNKLFSEEEENVEYPIDDIDRAIYFTLELIKNTLEGNEKSANALKTINDLMDGRLGNLDKATLKIADRLETMDDKKIGRAPQLKKMFLGM